MLAIVFPLLIAVIPKVDLLLCHSCSGAVRLPSFISDIMTQLNLTDSVPIKGNCSATTGDSACSDGLFCSKKAVVYKIGFNGINYDWSTYTKGCTSTMEDNKGVPSNKCYDIAKKEHTGFEEITRHCYCQSDFCNSYEQSHISSVLSILLVSFIL